MTRRTVSLLLVLTLLTVSVCAGETALAECWQGLSPDGATYQECPLGDYTADSIRQATGADIVLLPAGLLAAPLVGDGSITEADLEASFPDDPAILVARISEDALRALLEDGAAHLALNQEETLDPEASSWDGFLQISGFSVTLDASAPSGERVTKLETGQVLAAVPETMGLTGEKTGLTLRDCVRQRLLSGEEIVLPESGRIRIIGAHQRELISYVPPGLLAVVLVIVILGAVLSRNRSKRT